MKNGNSFSIVALKSYALICHNICPWFSPVIQNLTLFMIQKFCPRNSSKLLVFQLQDFPISK